MANPGLTLDIAGIIYGLEKRNLFVRSLLKTRLLLEEVSVRPAGGAYPVVCVGPNAPV